ncbi:MAG: HEAT repeat domain-containing protein [Micrococcales bacterium]|nr:HEAT repeat domain-containing protein [Micrococcales bacterium]
MKGWRGWASVIAAAGAAAVLVKRLMDGETSVLLVVIVAAALLVFAALVALGLLTAGKTTQGQLEGTGAWRHLVRGYLGTAVAKLDPDAPVLIGLGDQGLAVFDGLKESEVPVWQVDWTEIASIEAGEGELSGRVYPAVVFSGVQWLVVFLPRAQGHKMAPAGAEELANLVAEFQLARPDARRLMQLRHEAAHQVEPVGGETTIDTDEHEPGLTDEDLDGLEDELRALGLRLDDYFETPHPAVDLDSGIPILLKWLRQAPVNSKIAIATTLGQVTDRPGVFEALIAEFKNQPFPGGDDESQFRFQLAGVILEAYDDRWFAQVAELAQDRRYGLDRAGLIAALQASQLPEAVEVLISQLDDEDVQMEAIDALLTIDSPQVTASLELVLANPGTSQTVRRAAREVLDNLAK